jgi:hypothetical protein
MNDIWGESWLRFHTVCCLRLRAVHVVILIACHLYFCLCAILNAVAACCMCVFFVKRSRVTTQVMCVQGDAVWSNVKRSMAMNYETHTETTLTSGGAKLSDFFRII